MSYVGNRPWRLEESALRGKVWLDLDRPRQLGTQHFRRGVWRGRWLTCVSLGRSTLCVRFTGVQQRPTHPLVAGLGGERRAGGGGRTHWNTVLLEVKANTLCQNRTKNVLVQTSLREEISMVKSKNHCSAATVVHEDMGTTGKEVN